VKQNSKRSLFILLCFLNRLHLASFHQLLQAIDLYGVVAGSWASYLEEKKVITNTQNKTQKQTLVRTTLPENLALTG
jgi:hypothetical protein